MVAISSLGRHQVDLPHWPSWQNAHADHEHKWSINRCKDVHGGIFGKSYKRSRLEKEPLVHLQIRASLEVKSRFARRGPKFRICRNTRTPEKIVCAARKQFNAPELGERGLDTEVDIVIVGAGIIGLSIAHTLLHDTTFSVALVDRAQPCAGATGAGEVLGRLKL
jgi:heterodisulfide reductase subunit A-like polyferredoxin